MRHTTFTQTFITAKGTAKAPTRLASLRAPKRALGFFGLALVAVLAASLGYAPLSKAADSSPSLIQIQKRLDEQREQFLAVEKLAKNGELKITDPALAALHDYPLYPYLEYNRLVAMGVSLNKTEVERFRAQFPDSHLERMLRVRLMSTLASQGDWPSYIDYYQAVERPSTEQQCLFGRAISSMGDTQEALNIAASLWIAGKSQPPVCDPLFAQLRDSGKLDSKLALERVLNALDANRSSLATYAKRFIKDSSLLKTASTAQTVYQTPEQVIQLSTQKDQPELERMQHIAVMRAYRSSPERALELLTKLGSNFITSAKNTELLGRVGVRIAKDLRPEDRSRLAMLDPNYASSDLTEWRIRLALLEQDWTSINQLIAKLPDELKQSSRWRYWRAIANASLGQEANMGDLHQERSFYGFIAAELENKTPQLNQQSPVFTEELLQPLRASAVMQRIQELVKLDRYSVARSEWNSWTESMSTQERQAAARLMTDIGWYQMGILAAAYEGLWNDMVLRFPSAFVDQFEREANSRDIDPLWTLAVSRQESALFPWARSGAGARGLMQLMPRTAKETAKREKIPYRGGHELYESHTNIRLGSAYLAQMAERFNGNRVYATAAYNAGPHRVDRWLEGREALPLDIWIELIPFDETRTYVQNVLSFRVIYAQLRNQPRSLFSEQERSALVLASR